MDDNIINLWYLDFLLRQPIDDSIIKFALSHLPLPPDSSIPLPFKKSLLLRTLKSDVADVSISETLLELLESLEAIDIMLGEPVSGSMRDAYCAVALECTLRYLQVGAQGKARYSSAVQRIWRGRIHGLEGKSQLITAKLLSWRSRVEAALSDETEREKLMRVNGRADAIRCLGAYLNEGYDKLGPSFLEVLALSTAGKLAGPAHPPPIRESASTAAVDVASSQGKNSVAPEAQDSAKDSSGPEAGTACHTNQSIPAKSQNERSKMAVPCNTKQARSYRRTGGGIKITDSVELGGGGPRSSYDSLPTPLVDKVQESLKSSSSELQAAVHDPLPEAIKVAESLLPNVAATDPNPEPLPQDQAVNDARPPGPSLDQNALPRRSLLERHSSAQTYQWSDSPEGTSEPKDRDRPQLHSPKRLVVSPLRVVEPQKNPKRRRRRGWSLQEEDTLRDGVNRFGQGKWKLILNCYRDVFEDRTEVDLKDKWRNMTR